VFLPGGITPFLAAPLKTQLKERSGDAGTLF